MANVITVLGLTVYWLIHAAAVTAALWPIAIQAVKFGVLAKESLELPIVGVYAAPLFLLLDIGDLLDAMEQLFIACFTLPFAAGVLGFITGRTIRACDPHGEVKLAYIFSRSCVIAVLSCIMVAMVQPRFTTSYAILAVPALVLIALIFGLTLRAVAYPKIRNRDEA